MTPFSGRNVQISPYLQFYNATTQLVLVQGKDGDELFDILDEMQQCGDERSIEEDIE